MAFLQVDFFSEALNVASSVNVILPEPSMGIGVKSSGEGSALPKVLYLLHGYSDDHTIWTRRTSVERYASSYPLAVIMPAVNHSFYCNEAQGERYWDYVSQELPQVMHRFFRLSDKREDTFVAGLSMGGYGAMKLALTYPERFAAAGSFSGAVDIVAMTSAAMNDRVNRAQRERVFGDLSAIPGSDMDLFHLLEAHGGDKVKPRLYVSCGTGDFLYGAHKKFVPAAQKAGWDVTHAEEPDTTHEWGFWDRQIRAFIPWMIGDTQKK